MYPFFEASNRDILQFVFLEGAVILQNIYALFQVLKQPVHLVIVCVNEQGSLGTVSKEDIIIQVIQVSLRL